MHVLELGKMPPVDIFPFLNWVPERYSGWKKKVLKVKQQQEDLFGRLLEIVKRRTNNGVVNGSFMEEAYTRREEWMLSDSMLRFVNHLDISTVE